MERDEAHLLDIVSAARLALNYVTAVTRDEFLADVQRQDAVIRRLQVVGEASRRLSERARLARPGVPWHAVTAMRNRLVHEYDAIDLEIVWETVVRHLPGLIAALEESAEKG